VLRIDCKCCVSLRVFTQLNGHTAPNLKEAFQSNNMKDIHIYNLRNRKTDLAPPTPKREFGKRCFSYNGALYPNNLPHEAKIGESLSSFKSILKQRMSWNLLVYDRGLKIIVFSCSLSCNLVLFYLFSYFFLFCKSYLYISRSSWKSVS
jgi:hypothetical protein